MARLLPLPCTCSNSNITEFREYDDYFDFVEWTIVCSTCRTYAAAKRSYTKGNKIRAKKFARTQAIKKWNKAVVKELFKDL